MLTIAIDTETTGLGFFDKPFAIGAYSPWYSDYIDFYVEPYSRKLKFPEMYGTRQTVLPEEIRNHKIFTILEDEKVAKVFHNAKFDLRMLWNIGIVVRGPIHDTYIAAKTVNNLEEAYGLKPLAKKYLSIPDSDELDLKKAVIACRKMAKALQWEISDSVESDYWLPAQLNDKNDYCKKYCMMDCRRTYELWEMYKQAIYEFKQYNIYEREMTLLKIIFYMELRGVAVDRPEVLHELHTLKVKKTALEKDLRFIFGNINLESSTQLRKVLYEKLNLPIYKYTETGQPSTDAATIKKLANKHDEVKKLLEYRGVCKGMGYFENYLELIQRDYFGSWAEGVSLNPNFDQVGTRTGRFSCRNPNLQNVSNPETSGSDFVVNARIAFRPRGDTYWWCFDYSQLEARIFAELSNEEFLLEAFANGRDLHNECGERIWGDTLPTEQRRKLAKNVFFCKIFGGGPSILAERYGITYSEAKSLFDDYDTAFPGIKEWIQFIAGQAQRKGYIINAFGRRLYVEKDLWYKAANYTVQSSAADLIKLAMIRINNYIQEFLPIARKTNHTYRALPVSAEGGIVLTIHDELVIELPYNVPITMIKNIKNIMEDSNEFLQYPTPVNVARCNKNWAKKTKIRISSVK